MSIEYKLDYTAPEINEKLGKISEIDSLKKLVGEVPVSEQISEAIVEVYVQDKEPVDAPNNTIWVDTSKDGLPTPTKNGANVYVEDARTADLSNIDFSKYSIGDVIVITTS